MWQTFLIDLAKFTIPALVVFFTSYMLLRSYLDNDYRRRWLELRYESQSTILPLRLKAYERLSLFLERITPNNLVHRVRKRNMTARQLHVSMLENIRKEYQHNLSQQIYVSSESWELIKASKEEVVNIINNAASNVPADASSKELSKAIFQYLIDRQQVLPTQKALNKLKAEVQKLY